MPNLPNPTDSRRTSPMLFEIGALGLALLLCNLHLLSASTADVLVFLPGRVAGGEWWRVLTHPFVHVSWYHLALDAGAFAMLYAQMRRFGAVRRVTAGVVCVLGSLAGALMMQESIAIAGLCGLSGAAHGLMALVAFEQLIRGSDRVERIVGGASIALLVVKSVYEVVTNQPVFVFLHLGYIGAPLVWCHAGGVLAGLGAWAVLVGLRRVPAPQAAEAC